MKKLSALIFAFCIFFGGLGVGETSAAVIMTDYQTFNGHVLNGGVGNYGANKRYYFIASSASSYTGVIDAAMNKWIYTSITTPISFRKTTTQSSSIMDIHAGTYSSYPYSSANGWTELWRSGSNVDPETANWGWGKIVLNNLNLALASLGAREGTVAHEMGHVMGLDENNSNPNTVMCQAGSGRLVNSAQSGDLKGINYLY